MKAKKPEPKYSQQVIQDMLGVNDKAVCRAVVAIFNRQTQHEQSSDTTKETNGVGFTGPDARLMSKYAKQLLSVGYLSPRQTDIARGRMRKYWRQLAEIAAHNDAVKEARKRQAEDAQIIHMARQRSLAFA